MMAVNAGEMVFAAGRSLFALAVCAALGAAGAELERIGALVPRAERGVVLLAFKQRRQTLQFKRHGDAAVQFADQRVDIRRLRVRRLQRRAEGGEEVGIGGIHDGLRCEM